VIQLALGKKSATIDTLRKLVNPVGNGRFDHETSQWLRREPRWDPIRDDPRFQALLEKPTGAAPVAASTRQE
jgi:hypothetical protein